MKKFSFLFACLFFVFLDSYSQEKQDALERLKEGNKRFYTNQMSHQRQDSFAVEALKESQHPFAVVISCSDSRVTPEIVFDQGLGDIFCIRTAGNVMSDYEEGSVEYAVEHLGTELVVVLGHKKCGAVKAFLDFVQGKENHRNHNDENHIIKERPEAASHIKSILEKMESEEEQQELIKSKCDNHYERAVEANVINGVKQLRKSDPILKEIYQNGKVKIVGAIYDIDNGHVTFLDI
jgi:carbonic anhydrase